MSKKLLDRPVWKLIFILSLIITGYDFFSGFNLPANLQPTHPVALSIIIILLEILTLIASFGAATRILIGNLLLWQITLISQIIATILVYYYEFSAGGYTFNEMLIHINIAYILACIFFAPLLRYCQDFIDKDKNELPAESS